MIHKFRKLEKSGFSALTPLLDDEKYVQRKRLLVIYYYSVYFGARKRPGSYLIALSVLKLIKSFIIYQINTSIFDKINLNILWAIINTTFSHLAYMILFSWFNKKIIIYRKYYAKSLLLRYNTISLLSRNISVN